MFETSHLKYRHIKLKQIFRYIFDRVTQPEVADLVVVPFPEKTAIELIYQIWLVSLIVVKKRDCDW